MEGESLPFKMFFSAEPNQRKPNLAPWFFPQTPPRRSFMETLGTDLTTQEDSGYSPVSSFAEYCGRGRHYGSDGNEENRGDNGFRKVGSDVKIMGTYGKWPQNIND